MRFSRLLAGVIAIFVIIWIISGLIFSSETVAPTATQNSNTEQLLQVRVKEITAESFTHEIIITGRSQASKRVTIKAEINGQIQSLMKEKGEHVNQGDVIAKIEVRDRAAKVEETLQRTNQRRVEYEAAKSLEIKGFNSKIRLAQTKADLESARAALKLARVDLSKTKITAPFDGIIQDQYIEIGDYLDKGNTIVEIVNLDPIELVGFVSEHNILAIEKDTLTSIEFQNGKIRKGTISYISSSADNDTRTFRVEISLKNEDHYIKEGLTTKIRIPVASKLAHKISPSILTLRDNGQIGVKIVTSENKVQFIPVTILSDQLESMWVDGLPKAVKIITVGQDFVIEGQLVTPIDSGGDGLL